MRRLALLALLLFLAGGLLGFDDYGVGWDDGTSRGSTGLVNWNFVTRGAERPLLEGNEKYHGPAYELALVLAEKVLRLEDSRAIFLMRHLALFLTFALAVVAFHDVARRALGGAVRRAPDGVERGAPDGVERGALGPAGRGGPGPAALALAASAALVLSPRILGESFVNSKDLVFLSCSVLATWTLFWVLERPGWLRLAVHALATGILVDVRILGILHVALTAGCLAVLALRDGRARLAGNALRAAGWLALTAGFVVLFWPVLWLGPWHHFQAALAEMSRYHWEGRVLYLGERLRSTELPWHYLPLWIAISSPVLVVLAFLAGAGVLAARGAGLLARGPLALLREVDLRWVAIVACALGPVASVIALDSVVYDAWRHVFCVYPYVVLIAALGARELLLRASARARLLALGLAAANAAWLAVEIVLAHPHQNVWFNEAARLAFAPLETRFEQDYWGFAYRQGLEHVLAREPGAVRVAAANQACGNNLWILPPAERARVEMVADRAAATWWLTNYRDPGERVQELPPREQLVHQVVVRGVPILGVYRTGP